MIVGTLDAVSYGPELGRIVVSTLFVLAVVVFAGYLRTSGWAFTAILAIAGVVFAVGFLALDYLYPGPTASRRGPTPAA